MDDVVMVEWEFDGVVGVDDVLPCGLERNRASWEDDDANFRAA